MIGKLKGVVDSYGDDFVLLDVQGVCYQVHCPSRVLQQLPRVGEAAVLAIETMVREDMIKLFGFAEDSEREWFRILMTVQGVGAKVALGILGIMKASEVANAIALGDKTAITRAPGVGKRVAERIVTELKDKAPAFASVEMIRLRSPKALQRMWLLARWRMRCLRSPTLVSACSGICCCGSCCENSG